MQFMKSDLCAIMRIGMDLIYASDNPQNAEAVQKLVSALKPLAPEDQIESVMLMAEELDFETAATAVSVLGEEEYDWANELLYAVAVIDGELNERQQKLWDRFEELYWDFQEPDDSGAYDAYA